MNAEQNVGKEVYQGFGLIEWNRSIPVLAVRPM
jgi:hypothetical protein